LDVIQDGIFHAWHFILLALFLTANKSKPQTLLINSSGDIKNIFVSLFSDLRGELFLNYLVQLMIFTRFT